MDTVHLALFACVVRGYIRYNRLIIHVITFHYRNNLTEQHRLDFLSQDTDVYVICNVLFTLPILLYVIKVFVLIIMFYITHGRHSLLKVNIIITLIEQFNSTDQVLYTGCFIGVSGECHL